jgi:hypothetical protein
MNFWKRLWGSGCAHRFSWPRVDANGCHYQICPLCGIAYEYDWATMRRTRRLTGRHDAVHAQAMASNRQEIGSSRLEMSLPRSSR